MLSRQLASVSGLRRSKLRDHIRDSFDNGLTRMDILLCSRSELRLVFETFILFWLGLLVTLVAPFYFAYGKAEIINRFYLGLYFILIALGCLAWFGLSFSYIDQRIRQHKFRAGLRRTWVGGR